jgi:hypothetical protein
MIDNIEVHNGRYTMVDSISDSLYPQDEPQITAYDILNEVTQTVKERGKVRDANDGERSMERMVHTFNALTDHTLTVSEGWVFMIILKLVRMQSAYDRDNYIDAVGYAALLGECAIRESGGTPPLFYPP